MAPKAMEHEEEEVELFSRRLISATWKLVLGSFLLHVRTHTHRQREKGGERQRQRACMPCVCVCLALGTFVLHVTDRQTESAPSGRSRRHPSCLSLSLAGWPVVCDCPCGLLPAARYSLLLGFFAQ